MPLRIACAAAALGLLAAPALAADYPISGKWTYDDPSAEKAAASCGDKYMEFRGAQRVDTGGGVAQYRNVSVAGARPAWRVVDEFFTVQIRGRVTYTLRLVDANHVELQVGGKNVALRRCGS